MEYDPATGKLYGSTSVNDPTYNGLIEIDLDTGAGTPVGVHRWGLSGYWTAVTNITLDSNGQMYGWWDPGEDDLVSIDKTTGIATRVGESSVGTAQNGLDFDNGGVLYMVNYYSSWWPNQVYTVDPLTGAATSIGSIGITAHHGDFDPSTNLYYGISQPWGPRALVVADLSTLTVTASLDDLDDDIHVITFVGSNDPQTKDDCKKGGWEQYGFKNQGQCVRFIETGKDSRE